MVFHRVPLEWVENTMEHEFSGRDDIGRMTLWPDVRSHGGRSWSERNELREATFVFASSAGV
jgi:hypothetical protein